MQAQIMIAWTPDASNTVTADTFVVSRQVSGGAWAELGRTTPAMPMLTDPDVPMGVPIAWKAQVFAGSVAGPESPPVMKTMAQFTGVMTITVSA